MIRSDVVDDLVVLGGVRGPRSWTVPSVCFDITAFTCSGWGRGYPRGGRKSSKSSSSPGATVSLTYDTWSITSLAYWWGVVRYRKERKDRMSLWGGEEGFVGDMIMGDLSHCGHAICRKHSHYGAAVALWHNLQYGIHRCQVLIKY